MLDLIPYLLFLLFLIVNVISQILYKFAITNINNISEIDFFNPSLYKILAGIILQGIGVVIWLFILKQKGLAWAGVMSSIIPLSMAITAYFVFNEDFNYFMIFGLGIVILGLIIFNIPNSGFAK